jgi:uncharacterized membrane protein YbhN (UPF0104 family)
MLWHPHLAKVRAHSGSRIAFGPVIVRVVMSQPATASRQILLTIGRATITLAAIAIIFPQIRLGLLSEQLYNLSAPVVAAILVVLVVETSVIAGLRLRLVLEALGVKRSRAETSRVALAGFFFEQVAFGFVGGDGMRLWLLHQSGVASGKSLKAIVIDRCLGLLALMLLALIGLPNLVHLFTGVDLWVIVGAGALMFVLGLGGLLVLLRGLASVSSPLTEIVASASAAFRNAKVRRCFLIAFALAAITHILNVLVFVMLGRSLGLAVTAEQWFFVVPSALLLSMLPISAGGWGMREACFIVALKGLGIPAEQAILPSIIFGLGVLVAALPGGLVWLTHGRQSARDKRWFDHRFERLPYAIAMRPRSPKLRVRRNPRHAVRTLAAQPSICFVVPCYNEEDNVAVTVGSIRGAMAGDENYEIILVDDCSTDRTLQRMHALSATDARIRVLHNPVNLGFGGAYKRGMAAARAKYVMMLPGDDGFPAASIAEVIRHAGRADIIIPIVTNAGVRRWYRVLASRGFTTLLNWLFWLDVGYYNGAVLQRTALLHGIEIKTNSFAYQAEALVKLIAKGATYTHCCVTIQERGVGRSSALSLKNQFEVWRTILHLMRTIGLFRLWAH